MGIVMATGLGDCGMRGVSNRVKAGIAGLERGSALSSGGVGTSRVGFGRHRRLLETIWVVYFALVPVVWLPGIPVLAISLVKSALITIGVLLTWAPSRERDLPSGLAGPMGFAMVALSSSFLLFQAPSLGLALRFFFEIGVGFVVMWTIRRYQISHGGFPKVAARAAVFHGILSLLIIGAFVTDSPVRSPSEFGGVALFETGFGTARTGWSVSVALLIPFATAAAMVSESLLKRVGFLASVALTIVGQVIVGGRSGLLAGIVGIAVVVWGLYRYRGIFAMGLGLVAIAVPFVDFLVENLRFDRLATTPEVFAALDRFSAGRITSALSATDLILERPIWGHGFQRSTVQLIDGTESSIHNLWLRLAVEGGVLLLVAFALVVTNLFARGVRLVRTLSARTDVHESAAALGALAALASGVVISLFEPSMILGSMFGASIWWASAGAITAGDRGFMKDTESPWHGDQS